LLINIAIRGFVGRKRVFEDRFKLEESTLDQLLPDLAEKHGRAIASNEINMIEIEFVDEPDPLQRFFRIGTDPSGMVWPIAIDLRTKQ
jgi:hypothetical protein